MDMYCVTFSFDGQMVYAVNEQRRYGDKLPTGVFAPEKRCAMEKEKAKALYEFMKKESSFRDVALRKLPKAK